MAKAVAYNELLVMSKLCGLPEDQYTVWGRDGAGRRGLEREVGGKAGGEEASVKGPGETGRGGRGGTGLSTRFYGREQDPHRRRSSV